MASLVCRRSSTGHLKKVYHLINNRYLSTSSYNLTTELSSTLNFPKSEEELFKEKEEFIPLTKHTLFRYLVQDDDFLNGDNKKLLENLSLRLGMYVNRRYNGKLNDLKHLFEPINPDLDSVKTHNWTRRECLDNEFWLMKGLNEILLKANFKEISDETIKRTLSTHSTSEGVRVEVDSSKYDIMKFWAIGKEKVNSKSIFHQFFSLIGKASINEQYKRVVVASRLRKDNKLSIKAFKDISSGSLEQLLPDAKISMSHYDKTIITISAALAGLGGLSQTIAYLVQTNVTWPIILILITATKTVHSIGAYKNKRNRYLLQLQKVLYNKNIANNRGLLTLIIDRAEDEIFKEILLVYSFLLFIDSSKNEINIGKETNGIPITLLDGSIESWILQKTGREIKFNSQEAVEILTDLKIISNHENGLFCLPLSKTIYNLPVQSTFDMLDCHEDEGYDEKISEKKEKKYFDWFKKFI